MKDNFQTDYPHRRKNILTGEWVLVSPHRTQRPWQGEVHKVDFESKPVYDPDCYLCPGNKRANGEFNPNYKKTFVFTNDFPALLLETKKYKINKKSLLVSESEKGICRVVNFSPRHNLTIAEMNLNDIKNIILTWQKEYRNLGMNPDINYVQIFENKGTVKGNSNPHPHCQICAQKTIQVEPL